MEALAVKLERLLEQHFVLGRPFVRERCEVGQIEDGPLQVVLVPEQHAERLLAVVAVALLGHGNVVLHCVPSNLVNKSAKCDCERRRGHLRLLSGMSLVGDQTSSARSGSVSGLLPVGIAMYSGHCTW